MLLGVFDFVWKTAVELKVNPCRCYDYGFMRWNLITLSRRGSGTRPVALVAIGCRLLPTLNPKGLSAQVPRA